MTHRCTSGMLGGQADHGVLYCLLYHKHKNLRASIPHCKKKRATPLLGRLPVSHSQQCERMDYSNGGQKRAREEEDGSPMAPESQRRGNP